MTEKPIRAFIAAEIDDGLRERLAGIIARLHAADARVKWVRPENLHWTVKFLGEVSLLETGAIAEAAARVCARHRPFEGRITGVRAFPPGRRLRMVAAAMDEGGLMAALWDDLEPAMEEFGIAPDGRGFKAHLTMGRIKGSRNLEALQELLRPLETQELGECFFEEVTLFQSELGRSGPTYTALARIPLGS